MVIIIWIGKLYNIFYFHFNLLPLVISFDGNKNRFAIWSQLQGMYIRIGQVKYPLEIANV